MTIRSKFAAFTSTILIVTTVIVAAMAYWLQRELIIRQMKEQQSSQAAHFAAVCGQAQLINNELLLVNYIRVLKESPGVSFAYFNDSTGKILIHSDPAFIYKPFGFWFGHRPHDVDEVYTPVHAGSQTVGDAVVGFSQKHRADMLDRALRQTMRQIATATLGIAILALAAALGFAYILTKPIKALMAGSDEVAKGNFNTTVLVDSGDEVGELARRFNEMSKSLAVLDELKDSFISSVSHDLRSPMSAIKMYADYVLNHDDDKDKLLPKHRDVLVLIIDNVMRLNVFVTNILDTAKMKAGRMEYHPKAMSVEASVQNVQSLFGMMANKHKVLLIADVAPDFPPIFADPERFDQVLSNLISNALKFTPEGGSITLGARRAGDKAQIFVADTGRGIPEDEVGNLFQRFTQAEVADQRAKKIQGTGLGLYIVKRTIEGMGGAISVESALGKGTRFTLTLPLSKEPVDAEA